MPYQVNWQSVTTKSWKLLHVVCAGAAAAGGAFFAVASADDASAACAAPANARTTAAKMLAHRLNLLTSAATLGTHDCRVLAAGSFRRKRCILKLIDALPRSQREWLRITLSTFENQ
jgi:hypothetical protein